MRTDELIRNVRYTMKKHENDRVGFAQTNIYSMCRDILPALEELARYQEAEKATNEYLQKIQLEYASSYNVTVKEDTHIVIKRDDARKYLTQDEVNTLARLLHTIADGRLHDGKQPANRYYLCNTDEPYAIAVRDTILKGEAIKTQQEV